MFDNDVYIIILMMMIITIMRVMRMNFDNGYDHCLFSAQRHELQKRHKELLQGCQTKPHNLPIVEVQTEREKEVLNYNDEVVTFVVLKL